MKKYISVFEMITRSTLYKVLLVLIAMVSAQLYLFKEAFISFEENLEYSIDDRLELVIDNSFMIFPLAVGFILITVILCWSGCNIGSNQGYTLRRLRIEEKSIVALGAIYNCVIYLLLWASQVLVLLVSSSWYLQSEKVQGREYVTNQTLVLAAYKSNYMHSILPMEDVYGWVILLLMIAGCGIAAALFPYQQRRGNFGISVIVAVATTLIIFPMGMGSDLSFLFFYPFVLIIVYGIYGAVTAKSREEKSDE